MIAYLGHCNSKVFSQMIAILTICSFVMTVSRSFAFEQVYTEQALTEPSLTDKSTQAANKARVGQVIKKTHLLKLPNYQSDIAGTVTAKEKINIQRRKSAWYFISTTSNEQTQQAFGWVNMLNVRFAARVKREGELGIESLFSSVTNDSLPTVSTGIRGFDESDLKNSKADLKQLLLLNTYAVSTGAAKRFAKQGKLKTNKIKIKED